MNYGTNSQDARRVERMRQYRQVAERGLNESDRREYRKRFNRMVAADPEFAKRYGFERMGRMLTVFVGV